MSDINLLQANVLLGLEAELARDILQDLYSVLKHHKAELFYRHEQRAMLLMTADRSKEVGGQYRVSALLKRIAQIGTRYDRGIFEADPVLQPNMIRPADHSKVEDIIKSMLEVLSKHCAMLEFDMARRGMVLSQGLTEIALVHNITRFGADLDKGTWRFDTEIPAFEASRESEVRRLQAEMAEIRGGK